MPGDFAIRLRLWEERELLDDLDMAGELTIVPRDIPGVGRLEATAPDVVFLPCNWSYAVWANNDQVSPGREAVYDKQE
jgi:hypothetical protein